MSDELPSREAIKARLLEQVAADFDRDWAAAERLAAKYPGLIKLLPDTPAGEQVTPVPAEESPRPQDAGRTLESLATEYCADDRSPYRKVRFHTRRTYDALIRRLIEDSGPAKLAELKAADFQRLYDGWKEGGKMTMAHGLATMLRQIIHFGYAVLGDAQCERLSVILHNMRFKVVKSRSEPVTAKQAKAIISKAHAMGLRSIALAQAFQFECKLPQKDVIGEWVPISEQGTPSDVINGKTKWLQGIRWSDIDSNMILRHTTSRGKWDIEIDLKLAPLVMEELRRRGSSLPSSGPVVVFERTTMPYVAYQFRREWRLVADAAGVPKRVKNMNSRADTDEDAPAGQGERESAR